MRWVIAGGGTGGHLFPALALAHRIRAQGGEVFFIGCGRRVEALVLKETSFPVATISGEGLLGRSVTAKIRAIIKLLRGVREAADIIRKFSAEVVFGTGGYASFPALVAGRLLGKWLGLHEQNAVAGMSNRLAGHLVHRVFVSFPEAGRYFPRKKVIHSGNPIREDLFEERSREHMGRGLLVLGGSQGARSINRLLVETAEKLFERISDLYLIHQTGEKDEAWVKEAYQKKGLPVKVYPFIRDMAWAYAQADLVVSRAGATTVAELCALGKPAIYIPFPYATHAHQEKNALSVVRAGGGLMMKEGTFTPEEFVRQVVELLSDVESLRHKGEAARRLFKPGAAETIISEMEALANA
ncbi:undecaprenyldiphospho-muramoylpentapeptide beta-N-acetylglucosaminyltransferase [Thermosulfurimonas dismutans]|uniref:UDP-N-acetylglucosamine--N-acetylmuramyl-(pentapeptide) pyrophosphoryl-undecaprenol N-acetylglucosamine transferase n=1 Tax=Thermosulfurimonas dismutans TaxID=999894 RepID=A0A179D3D1_9BACT|nr:undecaprenyldiphospho-muramoylpentapeptide beta-N-acetylglucosaminyltransferase [Thermosulfurimonas dismutans]OAQ20138.1 UDP-N-acetylglucosamine--N-acetylmuramyl-(pentapeptide) pyrophosphoryl-undecaprenol N-acetylglucosamine transferase [Thermosulfurimonas dismutans]